MKKKNKNGKKQRRGTHKARAAKLLIMNTPTIPVPPQAKDPGEAVSGAIMLEKTASDRAMQPVPRPPDEIIYVSWWKARFLVVNGSRRSILLLGMVLVFLLLVLVVVVLVWHR